MTDLLVGPYFYNQSGTPCSSSVSKISLLVTFGVYRPFMCHFSSKGWAPVLLKSPARNAKVCKVQDKTFLHSKLCKKFFSSTVFPGKCFSRPDIREKSPGFRKVQEKSAPLSKVHEKSALPQKNSRWSCQLKTQMARAISLDCQARAAKAACNHVGSLCLLFFKHFL